MMQHPKLFSSARKKNSFHSYLATTTLKGQNEMKNVFTATNLKSLVVMAVFAAIVAVLTPSIKITVETNLASACNAGDPGCHP